MKTGTPIVVSTFDPGTGRYQFTTKAKIARTTKAMSPPPQYYPVRFADGGVMLMHRSHFTLSNR